MLDANQKKRIFQGIPESFTINNTNFNASKFYANQFVQKVYPSIILSYDITNTRWTGPLTILQNVDIVTTSEDGSDDSLEYSYESDLADVLTVNIYTADGKMKGMNSVFTVEQITREIRKYFEFLFNESDMTVVEMSDIRSMDSNQGSYYERRRMFDIYLRHGMTATYTVPRIKEVKRDIECE